MSRDLWSQWRVLWVSSWTLMSRQPHTSPESRQPSSYKPVFRKQRPAIAHRNSPTSQCKGCTASERSLSPPVLLMVGFAATVASVFLCGRERVMRYDVVLLYYHVVLKYHGVVLLCHHWRSSVVTPLTYFCCDTTDVVLLCHCLVLICACAPVYIYIK